MNSAHGALHRSAFHQERTKSFENLVLPAPSGACCADLVLRSSGCGAVADLACEEFLELVQLKRSADASLPKAQRKGESAPNERRNCFFIFTQRM